MKEQYQNIMTATEQAFYAGVLTAWAADEIADRMLCAEDIEINHMEAAEQIYAARCNCTDGWRCTPCELKRQCLVYMRKVLEVAASKEVGR